MNAPNVTPSAPPPSTETASTPSSTDVEQRERYRYYMHARGGSENTRQTLALVLAGGEGSRLKNLTKWRAKPAVPFGGKYRIIDFTLSNCINSGIRRVGVLTQYKSHSLIRHLQRAWSFLRPELGEFVEMIPAQMRLKQEWYKGTADAVYQNLDIVFRHEPSYVLVLSGDHIYTMDYARMIQAHVESGADVTIGGIEVPIGEASSFGVMQVNEDLRIVDFEEKPARPKAIPGRPDEALVSMGIYVFSIGFLAQALVGDAHDAHSSHDFGRDVIPRAIRECKVFAYPFVNESGHPSYWRDVGTLDAYWRANMELCEIEPPLDLYRRDWPIWTYQPQSPPAKFAFDDEGRRGEAIDSLVAGGVILSGARVKRSVIFFNTHVETGTLIKDSVVLPKVRIGKNCTILKAIIDKGTVIPDGFEVGVDPEADRRRFVVSDSGVVLITPGQLKQRLFYERDDEL